MNAKRAPRLRFLWAGASISLSAAVVMAFGLLGVSRVASPSMAPTFDVGGHVVTTRVLATSPSRGDVVVFTMPASWIEAANLRSGEAPETDRMIKRVVAVAGDRVTCCAPGGRLKINGVVIEESYLADATSDILSTTYDLVVPEGHVWVLGDNRRRSFDSRAMQARDSGAGSLPTAAIDAKVLFGF